MGNKVHRNAGRKRGDVLGAKGGEGDAKISNFVTEKVGQELTPSLLTYLLYYVFFLEAPLED